MKKKAAKPKQKVQPIPAGYGAVIPYLSVRGAAQAIEFYRKAFGAKEMLREVEDQFYGDRRGTIEDPYGHVWHVATHTVDVSAAEMKRRVEKMVKQAGG